MKRLLLFLVICLVLCSQAGLPNYRAHRLPDPLPSDMEGLVSLDTILVPSWFIYDYNDSVIYPALVGYNRVVNERSMLTGPPINEMLKDAKVFFFMNPDARYYENYFIKVFVSKRKCSDYMECVRR